ncbi:MAG TPA: hypothetical protein VFD42_06300, partial [Chloroflexota bacterium]|nr:hypothetical protein [Chloroflexota bacterium]
ESLLDHALRKDHRQADMMGRIVRRFPDAGYAILTSAGEGKSVLIPLMLGEMSFREAFRRLPSLLALGRSGGTDADRRGARHV